MMTRFSLCIVVVSACGGSEPARDVRVETSFSLTPGEERYECYRLNIDDDVFVTKIATNAANGVHHQILGITEQGSEPEGSAPCSNVGLSVTESWLFVASNTAQELQMPPDVAYRIPGGSQLVLQMHLLNRGDEPLNTDLAIDLTGIAEADVGAVAQLVAAGSIRITLPPQENTTVNGSCSLDRDVSVFGLLPHMHFMGTTFKASIGDNMLYDGAFLGETQLFGTFPEVAMPKGTPLSIQCDYFNSTDQTIAYGSSGFDEMCFAFTYYYPAIDNQGPLCVN